MENVTVVGLKFAIAHGFRCVSRCVGVEDGGARLWAFVISEASSAYADHIRHGATAAASVCVTEQFGGVRAHGS